jgi:hypothetical protein
LIGLLLKFPVAPVLKVPVKSLSNKFVATQVRLENGSLLWAALGNLEVSNPSLTKHFLSLSVLSKKGWFHLARYHDFDFHERGPDALAFFFESANFRNFPHQIRCIAVRERRSQYYGGAN